MANQNQILPFGTTTGAAVLAPAAYAALGARLSGFASGIADPAQCNTVWRQASVVAAAVAQLAADYGPSDVLDDGNVTTLENQILAAIRAITVSEPAASIPYEGQDTGSTSNLVFVSLTAPQSATIAAGQIYIVTKSPLKNTSGGVQFKNGSNNPIPVKWPDGTDLNDNDWPANGTAWLFVVSQNGNLIAQFMTPPRLNFPGLTEQDAVAATDVFAYYDQSASAHVKIPFSVLASAILAAAPASLINPQVFHCRELRQPNVAPSVFPSAGTWTNRILNDTTAGAQIVGANLNTATGTITLPVGNYRISAFAYAHGSGMHQIRIVTGGGTVLTIGPTADSHVDYPDRQSAYDTNTTNNSIILETSISLAATTNIQLQHCSFTSPVGKMGDDSTGYTTFLDSALNILKESGT